MNIRYLAVLAGFCVLSLGYEASAQTQTNVIVVRNVVSVGCSMNALDCWVEIDGDPVGPAACSKRFIRWTSQTTAQKPGGANALPLITAGYLAGKKLSVTVDTDTCFSGNTNFPTMDSFDVVND